MIDQSRTSVYHYQSHTVMSYPSVGNYWLTTLFALCTLFSMTQCGARGLRTHFV